MAEVPISFDNSTAYERAMGHWSRAVGPVFLDWVAAPSRARWLEIGCGTGIFTELILDACSPASVSAVDPSVAQIDHAVRQQWPDRVDFQVADAQTLPFPEDAFDVVASALVLNFIPDRPRALSEMRRVARAGGVVAGYVWDFSAELSPSGPLRRGMRRFGVEVPQVPGTEQSSIAALGKLFEQAGLRRIDTKTIEATQVYSDFDDFWLAQTPSYSPTTKMIAAMTENERARLKEAVRAALAVRPDGKIEYSARANAIKAYVPA